MTTRRLWCTDQRHTVTHAVSIIVRKTRQCNEVTPISGNTIDVPAPMTDDAITTV